MAESPTKGAGSALGSKTVGGLKGWQVVAGGAVVIALFLYLRSRGSAAAGTVTLAPPASSTAPFTMTDGGVVSPPVSQPPVGLGDFPPNTNPPDQVPPLGGGVTVTPVNVADTITMNTLHDLGQKYPAYNDPHLAQLYPGQGPNFPFSQSSQTDCGSNQTFVNAQTGCLNNDAYARMFGAGHTSQPLEIAHP